MKFSILTAVLGILFVSFSAQAGNLFPPDNSTSGTCPQDTALVWSTVNDGGHVDCVRTTDMVSFACPANQALQFVDHGTPHCAPIVALTDLNMSCPPGQILSGIQDGQPNCIFAPLSSLNITCGPGEVLTGIRAGSPACTPIAAVTPITVNCPPGQVLQGISNGAPNCATLPLGVPLCGQGDTLISSGWGWYCFNQSQ